MLALVTVIRPKGMDIAQFAGGDLKGQDMKSRITTFLKTDFTAKDKMKNIKKKHQVPLSPDGKVILTNEEYRAIEYLLIRDKIDMGVLKPFLSDLNVVANEEGYGEYDKRKEIQDNLNGLLGNSQMAAFGGFVSEDKKSEIFFLHDTPLVSPQ
jgi:hypothetical protein